jgi:hypothetical protein
VVAAALAAVACSESRQPLPQEVQFQFTSGTPECDYQATLRLVYFDRPDRNTVKARIRDMKAAGHDGDVEQETAIGFEVIADWIEPEAPIEDETRRQQASDLINALLACMTLVDAGPDSIVGTSDDIAAYPGPNGVPGGGDDIPVAPATAIDFTPALSDTGAIGVRGGLSDPATEPVVSALCTFVLGTPCPDKTWGIEPANDPNATPPTDFDWGDVTGGQSVLFYGARTDDVPGGGEARVTEAFDWEKVPDIHFVDADVRVARCWADAPLDGPERVEEIEQAFVRVLPVSEPTFCAVNVGSASFESGLLGMLKSWTRTASGGLLFPQPLHASASPGRCCGGSCPDFTPFVVVDAGNVNLEFLNGSEAVDDATVGQELTPVTILAQGNNDTPLPEVMITLSAEVNQGSWVKLSCADLGDCANLGIYPIDTDGDDEDDSVFMITDEDCTAISGCTPDGTVTFEGLTLNKPGGYRLVARANLLGYPLAVITTNAFHVGQ